MADRPVCPMCREPGIHQTSDRCIEALRAERDRLLTLAKHLEPSIAGLGRYVPSYVA